MTENSKNGQQRPPKLNLPFVKRNNDAGSWIYAHRTALCITVISYLLLSIVFISSKIIINKTVTNSSLIIDFSQLEELERQLEEAEKINRQLNEAQSEDFSDVRNRASNENAELNDRLRDDRGTEASEIYDRAGDVENRVRANRENYERGLSEQQAMIDEARSKRSGKDTDKSVKEKGRVTVSYSVRDPVRYTNPVVPAYRCENGGEVTVNIALNHNGDVIDVNIDKASSSSDPCMNSTALEAARGTRFNIDTSAPTKQYGTITYTFIPQ